VNVIQNVIRSDVSDHNQPIVIRKSDRTGSHLGTQNVDTLPKKVKIERILLDHIADHIVKSDLILFT
jgi:hypothetical protein